MGFTAILKLGLLLCLISTTSCQPQTVHKNWLKFRQQIKPESKKSMESPPRNLKAFEPLEEPEAEVLSSFSTTDRFGFERLQIYMLVKAPPSEALLRRLSAKYQNQYAVVWLHLVRARNHFPVQKWDAQSAWFSSEIPVSRHYLDFEALHHDQTFYWRYE